MSGRKAKAAVIGVGLLGEQHAEAYAGNPRAELVMVHDLNAERAKAIGERYGVPYTTDVNDIATSDAEIVSVATPDHAHFSPTMAMLEAGKHVVCEKPLATITAEAKQMVDLARANNVKLTVNLGNRFNGTYMNIKDSVRSGEIGDPVFAYFRVSDTIWVPRKMLSWSGNSGPQWFLFAHTMDLMRWMLGQEANEVYAMGVKKILKGEGIDAFDAIQAMVKFDNTFATFETSWIVPEAFPHIVESLLTINGSNGRLQLDGSNSGLQISSDQVGKHMYARQGMWNYFKLPDWWWGALHDMVNCVLDGGEPQVSAADGLRVVAMIEAMERSIESGAPVKIDSLL